MRGSFARSLPKDDVREQTAWMLNWTVFAVFATAAAGNVLLCVLYPQHLGRYGLQTLEVAVVCAFGLALSLRGHVIAGGRWMVAAMCLFITAAAWTSGGIESSGVAGYLVVVALAGLIFGVRTGLTTAVVSVCTYGFLAYAQSAGFLPTPELGLTPLSRATDMVSFTLILAVIGALSLETLRRSRASAERELAKRRSAEHRLTQLLDHAPFGSVTFELTPERDLVVTETNEPALKILGTRTRDIVGMTLPEALPALASTDMPQILRRIANVGGMHEVDALRYTDDNVSGDFEMHAFQTGQNRVAVLFRKVGEKRRAELALREKTEELDRLFGLALDMLVITDMEGRILRANVAWSRSLGYTPEELQGTLIEDLLYPDDIATTTEALRALATGDNPANFTSRFRNKGGDFCWIEWRTARGGSLIYGAGRDITARVTAEGDIRSLNAGLEARVHERTADLELAIAELEETNRQLDAATRAKSEFLASMSHELRTPLNSIIGFSGVLASGLAGPLSEEQERQIRMVSASGQRLLGLVNQVLDLSKMESGEFMPRLEEFDVAAAVHHALDVVSPAARAKELDVHPEIPDEPMMIVSDRARIDQILLNLLGNAVKFTDGGSIVLRVYFDSIDVVLEVEDTGRGISENDLPLVFDRFYQALPNEGGKHEGVGLGLSITRELIQSLGGSVNVDSQLGRGSLFRVRLPRTPRS